MGTAAKNVKLNSSTSETILQSQLLSEIYDMRKKRTTDNFAKRTPFLWSGLQPANRRIRALSLCPFCAARCSAENPA